MLIKAAKATKNKQDSIFRQRQPINPYRIIFGKEWKKYKLLTESKIKSKN